MVCLPGTFSSYESDNLHGTKWRCISLISMISLPLSVEHRCFALRLLEFQYVHSAVFGFFCSVFFYRAIPEYSYP